MKKRSMRRVYIVRRIVCLVILGSILGIVSSFIYKYFNSSKDKVEKESVVISTPTPVIKEEKDYSLSMVMVGDALIHGSVYKDALISDGNYDFTPMLSLTKKVTSKYDIAYYNQETILGGEEFAYSSYPRFNSPTAVGDAFIDSGFNLVSLATNHTMDKGEKGVINSVNYWKSKENVVTAGQYTSVDERNAIKTYEKNNITYAFFSYTMWTNGLETPIGKEYLNNLYSNEKAKNDISKVRDLVDVVIVAMHWGTEYSLKESSDQIDTANYLSNLGVDIIIGTHPHVVQPVTYINNNKTFVIYSLGNYISDQAGVNKLTGLMMELTIKKHVDLDDNVTISIVEPKAELLYTKSYYNNKRNFKVYFYPTLTNELLNDYQSYYSKYKNIVSSKCPELVWGLSYE